LLFNSAPRKFKNLGTDAFIASRITKLFSRILLEELLKKIEPTL